MAGTFLFRVPAFQDEQAASLTDIAAATGTQSILRYPDQYDQSSPRHLYHEDEVLFAPACCYYVDPAPMRS